MELLTLQQLSSLLTNKEQSVLTGRTLLKRKALASILFLLSDLAVLSISLFAAVVVRDLIFSGGVNFSDYTSILPLLLVLFPATFYIRGLYPGFGKDVIEELRTIAYSITFVFAGLAALTFFFKEAWEYSRFVYLFSWFLTLVAIPLGRSGIRKAFSSKDWWGIPVIVIGAGNAGESVIKSLKKHRQIGLRPVVAVDDDVDRWGYVNNIPVVGGLDVIPELAKKISVNHAIIAMPKVPANRLKQIIETYSKHFDHTIVIPSLFGLSSLWVNTRDLGGLLGLELQKSLVKKTNLLKKRIFDIICASILAAITLPFAVIISILIKLDTKGRIFFRQTRMGRHDGRFEMVKFRTMYDDAELKLKELLSRYPELKEEYEVFHKLKNDPRMTKVGKFLRKFSLDELPQFWNVITGEMSLIGPRAYMPWEKSKMNGQEEIILQVKPGISGLWQVTDRNAMSFEERNETDVYYIRNWSMFLDIYILARTIAVVITGKSGL